MNVSKSKAREYWKLKKAKYKKIELNENQMWKIIDYTLDVEKATKTTTYKFALIHSIIQNLKKSPDKAKFSFNDIFNEFSEIYWKIIAHNKLFQMAGKVMSSIYQIINKYLLDNPEAKNISYRELPKEDQVNLLEKIKNKCSRNVFGALFGDSNETFYTFNLDEGYIILNPKIKDFLLEYRSIIEKLTFYEWLKFIAEKNPNRKIDILLFEK